MFPLVPLRLDALLTEKSLLSWVYALEKDWGVEASRLPDGRRGYLLLLPEAERLLLNAPLGFGGTNLFRERLELTLGEGDGTDAARLRWRYWSPEQFRAHLAVTTLCCLGLYFGDSFSQAGFLVFVLLCNLALPLLAGISVVAWMRVILPRSCLRAPSLW